jgi:hypothetical protein
MYVLKVKILYEFLVSHMSATYLAHLIRLDLIPLVIVGEQQYGELLVEYGLLGCEGLYSCKWLSTF